MIVSYITSFVAMYTIPLVIAIVFLVIEIGFRVARSRRKAIFDTQRSHLTSSGEIEKVAREYYNKNQKGILVRLVIYIGMSLLLFSYYDIRSFSFLAVALGAFVIVFKEQLLSLIAFFYIVTQYSIGDDIRIGENYGEILRIKLTFVSLLGKDSDGEHNGKLIQIPNHHFLTMQVQQQEMKSDTRRRVVVALHYEHDDFPESFTEWMGKLRAFLNEILPTRNVRQVGFFRSLAGKRYALTFEYSDKGFIIARVTFVAKANEESEQREAIIMFAESLRIKKVDKGTKEKNKRSAISE